MSQLFGPGNGSLIATDVVVVVVVVIVVINDHKRFFIFPTFLFF